MANLFDDRVYKRGALTLHGLRTRQGDLDFFATLREWTDTHRHGTATTADFMALAQRHTTYPLSLFFRSWLEEPHLPAL